MSPPVTANATIQAILARCIVEPAYLDELEVEQQLALSSVIDLDFDRMRKFAGFITKVQNNHLWDFIPLTRALLRFYNLEIEIFSKFRSTHQNLRSATKHDRIGRVREFISFLAGEVANYQCAAPGLADAFSHECAYFHLRNDATCHSSSNQASYGGNYQASDAIRPSVNGGIRVGYFDSDPLRIASLLSEGAFSPQKIVPFLLILGYWRPLGIDEIHVFQLSHPTAVVLSYIDGTRTIPEVITLAERTLAARIDVTEVEDFLQEAHSQRMLISDYGRMMRPCE